MSSSTPYHPPLLPQPEPSYPVTEAVDDMIQEVLPKRGLLLVSSKCAGTCHSCIQRRDREGVSRSQKPTDTIGFHSVDAKTVSLKNPERTRTGPIDKQEPSDVGNKWSGRGRCSGIGCLSAILTALFTSALLHLLGPPSVAAAVAGHSRSRDPPSALGGRV